MGIPGQRGQSVLYTVLLLPTLILVFALAVDVGSLEMQKLRLRWAVDLATVGAATAVDGAAYARTGRLRLDPEAATAVARGYLYRNLARLGTSVGGEAGATMIANEAEVAVINDVPARNPFTGATLDRPAVCARIRVPYRTGLMRGFGLPDHVQLTLAADAELKA